MYQASSPNSWLFLLPPHGENSIVNAAIAHNYTAPLQSFKRPFPPAHLEKCDLKSRSCSIATHGVIFAPGSAGTIQEVFQDAAQNHYKSFGISSPMIFLGHGYWKWQKPVFPLLSQLAAGYEYAPLLAITDSRDDIIKRITTFSATQP
ncbi:hypothetical protein [Gimesia sp.]|uniref:hypothetical protein n=1 Tax=Gimesia sp. TaxID=2024833 RepID=UPI003A947118